jgi:hypothetical protein
MNYKKGSEKWLRNAPRKMAEYLRKKKKPNSKL